MTKMLEVVYGGKVRYQTAKDDGQSFSGTIISTYRTEAISVTKAGTFVKHNLNDMYEEEY